MEINIKKNDMFDLSDALFNQMVTVINRYFHDLAQASLKPDAVFSPDDLIAISDAYDLLQDKNKWDEIIFQHMNALKKYIEGQSAYNSLSLFGGICHIAFAVDLIVKSTGYYKKFLESINTLIFQQIDAVVNYLAFQLSEVKPSHYDFMRGMAGTLTYILRCEKSDVRDQKAKTILQYFVELLTGSHASEGVPTPNFHIKREYLSRNDEKDFFKTGIVNMGVSHGLAGVVGVMCEAMKQGVIVEGEAEAIHKTLELFEQFGEKNQSGVILWPGMIAYEDFLTNNYQHAPKSSRQSWCYGAIGISGVYYGRAWESKNKTYMNNILEIADSSINEYLLDSPIICHGYSGVLLAFLKVYKDSPNIILKKAIAELVTCLISMYEPDSKYGFRDLSYLMAENRFDYVDRNSILEGTAGVVLTLLSTLNVKPMSFQTQFLL